MKPKLTKSCFFVLFLALFSLKILENVNFKSFCIFFSNDHLSSNKFTNSSALISNIASLKLKIGACCLLIISFSLSISSTDLRIEKSNGAIIVSCIQGLPFVNSYLNLACLGKA